MRSEKTHGGSVADAFPPDISSLVSKSLRGQPTQRDGKEAQVVEVEVEKGGIDGDEFAESGDYQVHLDSFAFVAREREGGMQSILGGLFDGKLYM